MTVQVFGRIRASIVILCVLRCPFEFATQFDISLWHHLVPPLHEGRYVVIPIGTTSNKVTPRDDIVARVGDGLLPGLTLGFDIV